MTLPPGLRAAYEATDYRVFSDPPLVLRPGEASPGCDALLDRHDAARGVVITAWNPMSVATAEPENRAAQARLAAGIAAMGLAAIPAEGAGRDGLWPPEPSLFVPGLSPEAAQRLARDFRQAAVLEITRGGAARVVATDFG
ncbi:DUF3293 domain-containing protein [Limimaricola pyoseonensis]|uniref:DUF3293 domain-containing protein n=1 Tax=Limimaricola pyoseonensis TaxID=521013 RepID=A0A1G7IZH2_9RHOB|nr:DUF3293 domain-containing protein [Limimaricola pyoseonensis]SDF17699.1 Protein of unknown function [Limimaricola pyoseonensis]